MKPYGWHNGRHHNAWKATKVLPTVRMTATARRWATVEINACLSDMYAQQGLEPDDDGIDWCDALDGSEGDVPPTPLVALRDVLLRSR